MNRVDNEIENKIALLYFGVKVSGVIKSFASYLVADSQLFVLCLPLRADNRHIIKIKTNSLNISCKWEFLLKNNMLY